MPKCLVIQHVHPESAFAIEDALLDAHVTVETCRVFAGEALPRDLSRIDGLVVMGGPMSATSDEHFATRRQEIALLANALSRNVPTLGVCLGAQLLALAGGGAVRKGEAGAEIGWGTVELLDVREHDPLFAGLADSLTVLHWHGDTFELPPDAQLLATNTNYPHQAFRSGANAWGLQFHLEIKKAALEGFLEAFGRDADQSPGGSAAMRSGTDDALSTLAPARDLVLSRFASIVAEHARSEGSIDTDG